MFLNHLSEWLSSTSFSLFLQTVTWIIPTVQTVHILSIAIVISAILLIDLRVIGYAMRGQPTVSVVRRFLPWIWYTLIVLLLSGAILIIAEPRRSLLNTIFQLKMSLLISAIVLTVLFTRPLRNDPKFWEHTTTRRAGARLLATASLAIWVGIVFAGRWIAYDIGV